ncbi:MAG: trigger factor [Pseudorhodoplanes sp.]|nr:trigger factor [Pseudorhodoplanes sp.]
MQVTETLSDGLRREYRVLIPAGELDSKVNDRLGEMKDRVRINGFRPGKVPVAHLKRVYGRAAMAEAIEAAVRDANAKIVADNNFRLAMQPQVTLPNEEKDVEAVIGGKSDLSYTVALEILAPIEFGDFKSISLTKLVADVTDEQVDEALKKIAEQNRPYADKGEGAKAESGDRVIISFVGKIDGAPFEGGTGEDVAVQLGSATFIPGFEDQLIGIAAGEQRVVKVTFPQNYPAAHLAGKEAEFDVTVKTVEAPKEVTINDDFAKSLGLESLDKLKDAVKERLARESDAQSRQRLKRELFDQLDEMHKFEVPQGLFEQEFQNLWQTAQNEMKQQGKSFADENTTEEAEQAEYRRIANRRVRLGLLLDEIARRNDLTVTDDETTRAVVEQVRQYPGREQELWDMFRKNPEALASIRAPILENKVTDFLLALGNVTDKKVTRDELYREDDDKAA